MTNKIKSKQLRLTLEDCLYYQNELRELLQKLIQDNRSLTHSEKQKYYQLLPKALLSQGTVDPIYMVKSGGWFIYKSVQDFALRLADIYTDKVNLKTDRPDLVDITIPIGELWEYLYDHVLFLCPKASSEAIMVLFIEG